MAARVFLRKKLERVSDEDEEVLESEEVFFSFSERERCLDERERIRPLSRVGEVPL